jgi:hypothetical protein
MKLEKFKKNKDKKFILIFTLVITFISVISITLYKSYATYTEEKSFDVIKGRIPEFSSSDIELAFTIDGEKSSIAFPTINGIYLGSDVTCDNGVTAKWDNYNWGLVNINSDGNSKIKCTITFEHPKILIEYITTLAKFDTTNLVSNDGTTDKNIRYIGADPNNYICFNSSCTGGKWRIIGVMNNMTVSGSSTKQSLVKVIKADSVGSYGWDNRSTSSYNNWTTSSLQASLNSGDLYNTYISSIANNFATVVWNLGGYSTYNLTAAQFYNYERGTTVYSGHETTWTGKIGLMYPSDYGYATSGGSTSGRTSCLSYYLGYNSSSSSYWNNQSTCYSNDYLYNSSTTQWTLTPDSYYSFGVFGMHGSGGVNDFFASVSFAVRPVGYLTSNLVISSGSGTSDSPYILN